MHSEEGGFWANKNIYLIFWLKKKSWIHHEIIYLQIQCTLDGGYCKFFNYNHETGKCCKSKVSPTCCSSDKEPNPRDDGETTYVLREPKEFKGNPSNKYKGSPMYKNF